MPGLSRRRLTGRIIAIILGLVTVAIAGCALWIGVRAAQARGHLATAEILAHDVAADFGSDPESVATTLPRIAQETRIARDLTSDPVWRLAEGIAWIGPQLRAVSTVTAAVDDVASDALQPLGSAIGDTPLSTFAPQNGTIDTAAIAQLAQPAAEAAAIAQRAAAEAHATITPAVLPALAAPLDKASGLLDEVAAGTDALARATALLPAMLGSDGPRNYLVIVQNNAEWRSLGGIAGAAVLVRTDAGRITLVSTDSGGALSSSPERIAALSGDDLAMYTDRPARYFQNVTQPVDFTTGAPLAKAFWERKHGGTIDGVISIDPVALSYLVRATGPIPLPTGDTLTADSTVPLLLNEVYLRYIDPKQQDAFFAESAAAVFGALTRGSVSPSALVEALSRAGDERRILLWSALPGDQSVLDGTTLQGRLLGTTDSAATVGVYLNDATGSKMDYYMRVQAGFESCSATDAELHVALVSTAPADAASLPRYITGGGGSGTPPGVTKTVTYLYVPPGYRLGQHSSTVGTLVETQHMGREVLAWTTEQHPGDTAEVRVSLVADSPTSPPLQAEITPGVYETETLGLGFSCGSTAQ